MQRDTFDSVTVPSLARPARTKQLNRPGTWFGGPSFGKSSASSNSSSSSQSSGSSSSTVTLGTLQSQPQPQSALMRSQTHVLSHPQSPSPFGFPNNSSFQSPFPSSKGKHKLSPSPSPRHSDDFVMISPVRPPQFTASSTLHPSRSRLSMTMSTSGPSADGSARSSSPIEDSPTPACGMASAAARLKLVDDDSPIRRVPGQSRSLRNAIDDGGRSIFMSTEKWMQQPGSPIRSAAGSSLFPGPDNDMDDMDDGSPLLPPTPLMGAGPPPPPPQPLFPPLRTSQSQDCDASTSKSLFHPIRKDESRIPRLSASHPLRARAATDADRPTLGQKKAVSLESIPTVDADEPFGIPISTLGKKSRPPSSMGNIGAAGGRAHKRINSGEYHNLASMSSISRSFGQKSGLALSLTPSPNLGALPDLSSNSSLSSLSTTGMTPPVSAFSPAEPPIFEHVKPLAEAFAPAVTTVSRKFKPRDSGVALGDEDKPQRNLIPPPSVMKPTHARRRPPMLKRTSSMGDERPEVETPSINPSMQSGWPGTLASTSKPFDFLGETGVGLEFTGGDKKPAMPNTPVKKHAYGHSHGGGPFGHKMNPSNSQPTLASSDDMLPPLQETYRHNIPSGSSMMPPPTVRKPPSSAMKVPHLTLTTTSSPDSPSPMETDHSSPTVRIAPPASGQKSLVTAPTSRVGMLRRQSSGAGSSEGEEDGTPTKGNGGRLALAQITTPTPSPHKSKISGSASGIYPRLSLPAFAAPKQHRTLHHRQSHPAPASSVPEEEDLFERRFITLENLGKGAFSTVVKVQDRYGEGLYAVKKARGVFDGVKDRLRHLEEVDILRHLSKTPNPHVIKFEDAWEQNRQLFIQTELCLGSLAFFLEEYGRVVERLDEGRVWKIVRELSDGINHIHSSGVIHFDIKPANVLISASGSLKIGDFGMATRWPRVSPAEIIHGSGLGGVVPHDTKREKLEREGDRVYMPPEMLQGVFVMAADIFSFGLVILEVSTNICVPDGGAPWQALRDNDFSVVDLSPLSPALTDLIVSCMAAEPSCRPEIKGIVGHPIVQRARTGKEALAPEDPRWLAEVLSGSMGFASGARSADGDVEMSE